MFSSTQKLPTKRMTTTSTTILLAVVTAIVLVDYAASADMADSRDASKLAFAGTQSALPNSVAIQHDEKRSLRSDDTATAEAAEERVSPHVPLDALLQGKINEYLAFGYLPSEAYEWAKTLRAILMKDFLHANPTEKFRHTIPTEQSDMHIIEHILDKLHQKVPNSKPGPLNNVVEKTSKVQHAGSSPAGLDAQAKLKIEELKYTLFREWFVKYKSPSTTSMLFKEWKGKYKELLTSFAIDYQNLRREHGPTFGQVAKKKVIEAQIKLSQPENVTPRVETQAKKPVAASSDRTNEYNDKYSRQWSGKLNHEEGGKVQEGWPQRGEREEGKREEGWKRKEREELKEREPKRGKIDKGKLKEGEFYEGDVGSMKLQGGELMEGDPNLVELKKREAEEN